MPQSIAGWQEVLSFLQGYIAIIIPALLALNISLLILVLLTIRSKRRVYRRYHHLVADFEEKNLDFMLVELRKKLGFIEQNLVEMESQNKFLESSLATAIRHVGVVRYNAFPEVGSDLSFSIALLDKAANGVVITSIYGREESRVFAKPILAKSSSYRLTDEEKQAIAKALQVSS